MRPDMAQASDVDEDRLEGFRERRGLLKRYRFRQVCSTRLELQLGLVEEQFIRVE